MTWEGASLKIALIGWTKKILGPNWLDQKAKPNWLDQNQKRGNLLCYS